MGSKSIILESITPKYLPEAGAWGYQRRNRALLPRYELQLSLYPGIKISARRHSYACMTGAPLFLSTATTRYVFSDSLVHGTTSGERLP